MTATKQSTAVKVVLLLIIVWITFSCDVKNQSHPDASSPKFQLYMVQGEMLYIQHCSNCHQKDGKGLGLLYPPVNQSDYMAANIDSVICLIRYGKRGPLIVNGNEYNHPMPGIAALTDLEIAEITTYIYNAWDLQRGLIDVKYTTKALSTCQ